MSGITPATAVSPPSHAEFIGSAIPSWLLMQPAETLRSLRHASNTPLPWLKRARRLFPGVMNQLQTAYRLHLSNEQQTAALLSRIPPADVFAAPLLAAAIKQQFGRDLDVRRTFLHNAARVRSDSSFLSLSEDPVVATSRAFRLATCSLLDAALQNFEAWEAEPDGMSNGRSGAYLFTGETGMFSLVEKLDISPEQFAALCRHIDLGGQYKALIESTMAGAPVEPMLAAGETSAFLLHVHLACVKETLSAAYHAALLQMAGDGQAQVGGVPLMCRSLSLWGIELTGAVAIARHWREPGPSLRHWRFDQRASVVVYIADDPVQPLKEYPSLDHFYAELRDRLFSEQYRKFFMGLIPARQRGEIMGRLQRTLYPKVWNSAYGLYEEKPDKQASLDLRMGRVSKTFFVPWVRRKITLLKDDGLYHAVPTAAQDHKSLEDKLRYVAEIGLDVLNVASFVFPQLGLLMLGVTAVQLGHDVYEGFDSLAKGDRDQAMGYLMDVAENLVQAAVLGGVTAGAGGLAAIEVPPAVAGMRTVHLADGSARLWKPDLVPFAHDIVLPEGLKPDAQGLYHHQGKQWLALDGRTYAVRPPQAGKGYRLEHPTRPVAYEPGLRHNGEGAWLHELDRPLEWDGLYLLRRLGPQWAECSDELAVRILRVSNTHEAQLRQVLADGGQPPGLLRDTFERFCLDAASPDAAAFDAGYQVLQQGLSAEGEVIARSFSGLPKAVIEELLGHASEAELAQLRESSRIALRLSEEARACQRNVRLARASEALFLQHSAAADGDRLALHMAAALPGWPADLRLEVRQDRAAGALLDAIGPQDAATVQVLLRDGTGYLTPNSVTPDDVFGGLWRSLSLTQREALGVADKAALRGLLQRQPSLSRPALCEVLGIQPLKPAMRSPMRLADGRLGYLLSGRGALAGQVTQEALLDKIRWLEFEHDFPENILNGLYRTGLDRAAINERLDVLLGEQRQLSAALSAWADASAAFPIDAERGRSRTLIGEALWAHWRANALPELGTSAPLTLASVSARDFPERLPAFVYERTRALVLRDFAPGAFQIIWAADGQPRPVGGWEWFLSRFERLTSLEIIGTASDENWELPHRVRQLFPGLVTLRLSDLQLVLGQGELTALSSFPALRFLDLSGNRLDGSGLITGLAGVALEYLGLERMELSAWPYWLGEGAMSRIGEVALCHNRLTELPETLLANPQGQQRTRILLQGNALSRQTIVRARISEAEGRRYSFVLEVPPALEQFLGVVSRERSVLREALEVWVESPVSTRPMTSERRLARRTFSESLLRFWDTDLQSTHTPLLQLNALLPRDFPLNLPPFFYARVRRLTLIRPRGELEELNRLLLAFPELEELEINGHAQPLVELPPALLAMNELRVLGLIDQNLTIDQAAVNFLAQLPELWSLTLDGNRLGAIRDVSAFRGRVMSLLSLNRMALNHWPQWLVEMLPGGVEVLNLNDNQLVQLPERFLANRRNPDVFTEISLLNNPLSHETMRRAHISEAGNRPFVFRMDLPEDIRQLPYEPHGSDSDPLLDSSEGSDSSDSDSYALRAVEAWLLGSEEENLAGRQVWEQIERDNDAADLLRLIARLRHTADYRVARTRTELSRRVWHVLGAAAEDAELRQTLNGMAQEPLVQLRAHDTCPDGIRLEFNQMEIQVFTRQSLRDIAPGQRGPTLYRLMRRLYRLQTLDAIAREQAGTRDEAEVRLAYRMHWAEELDLPLAPGRMLYRSVADIRPGELDRALERVLEGEGGQGLLAYAAQRDFWVEYLRETWPERFRALKEAFEAEVLGLIDQYPTDTAEQASARIRALEARLAADERSLINALTNQQGLAQA